MARFFRSISNLQFTIRERSIYETVSSFVVECAVFMRVRGGLRYAATEAQRENAWLHERVCAAAAETAVDENASPGISGMHGPSPGRSERSSQVMSCSSSSGLNTPNASKRPNGDNLPRRSRSSPRPGWDNFQFFLFNPSEGPI